MSTDRQNFIYCNHADKACMVINCSNSTVNNKTTIVGMVSINSVVFIDYSCVHFHYSSHRCMNPYKLEVVVPLAAIGLACLPCTCWMISLDLSLSTYLCGFAEPSIAGSCKLFLSSECCNPKVIKSSLFTMHIPIPQ